MRKYLLAIERNNNDYIPIEWNYSILNNSQNITSLDEIDKLTSSVDETLLKVQFISENLISKESLHKPLVIIYEENNRIRKLEPSIVTNAEKEILEPTYVYDFIVNNINKRLIMNRLYNEFKDKKISTEFKKILTNINNFQKDSNNLFVKNLAKLSWLPYEELRGLALFIKRDLEVLLEVEKEKKLAMENNKVA